MAPRRGPRRSRRPRRTGLSPSSGGRHRRGCSPPHGHGSPAARSGTPRPNHPSATTRPAGDVVGTIESCHDRRRLGRLDTDDRQAGAPVPLESHERLGESVCLLDPSRPIRVPGRAIGGELGRPRPQTEELRRHRRLTGQRQRRIDDGDHARRVPASEGEARPGRWRRRPGPGCRDHRWDAGQGPPR